MCVLFPGKLCIEVTAQSKIVWISESLCIGCGICVKVTATTAYPLQLPPPAPPFIHSPLPILSILFYLRCHVFFPLFLLAIIPTSGVNCMPYVLFVSPLSVSMWFFSLCTLLPCPSCVNLRPARFLSDRPWVYYVYSVSVWLLDYMYFVLTLCF